MKLLTIFIVFLFLNAFLIISNNELALKEPGNFEEIADLYVEWVGNVFENFSDITGEVIRRSWVPSS